MKISNYTPKTNDRELLDFVNDVTSIINNGRIGVATTTSVPSIGSTDGELRIYANGTDVRLYALVGGTWYPFQYRPYTQSGWGYIKVGAGNPAYQTAAVTFPTAFTNAPYVMVSYIGVSDTAPATVNAITGANTLRGAAAYATSTTGFTVLIFNTNNGPMTTDKYECFAWQAIST